MGIRPVWCGGISALWRRIEWRHCRRGDVIRHRWPKLDLVVGPTLVIRDAREIAPDDWEIEISTLEVAEYLGWMPVPGVFPDPSGPNGGTWSCSLHGCGYGQIPRHS